MDELHAIWSKLDDLQIEVGALINVNQAEDIYKKLKKEEEQRDKWKPFMVPYVVCVMLGFAWLVQSTGGNPLTIIQIISLSLIGVAGLAFVYSFYIIKLPLAEYQTNGNTVAFLKKLKASLLKRRKVYVISMACYIVSLTIGIHLLIFGLDSLAGKGGYLGLFYGCMLGLLGASVGGTYRTYHKQYGDIFKRIDRFLEE